MNFEQVNQEADPKNCYLVSGWANNEDCMYWSFLDKCNNMIDCYSSSEQSNNCYEWLRILNSSKIYFSQHIKDSYNVYFSRDIIWSKNILFWYEQTNSEYIYKDKKYSKEDWEKIFENFQNKLKTESGLKELKKDYIEFLSLKNIRWQLSTNSENVIWSMVMDSKDIFSSIWINNSENIRYWAINNWVKDCMDIESYWWWEKLYNVSSWYDNQNNSAVTSHSWATYKSFYSYFVWNTDYNFWCFWLRNKKYCILNKQYSKEDWEEEVVKIIEEKQDLGIWGEFFEMKLSPFPYNDTVAMEYFPPKKVVFVENNKVLSSKNISENWVWTIFILEPEKFISKAIFDLGWEEKIECFYRTREQEINIPEWIDILFWKDIPDSIDEVWDDILNKAVICEESKRPFRITKKELEFYKKHWLPIPRKHYNIRHLERLKLLPNRWLLVKKCEVCGEDKLSNYPNYKNICEECYNKLY